VLRDEADRFLPLAEPVAVVENRGRFVVNTDQLTAHGKKRGKK
jgi:hypothetical protein